MSRLITSADKRVAAISNVVRVRVLFSKNKLNTLLPRSKGTFFTSRSLTLTKLAAVSSVELGVAFVEHCYFFPTELDSSWACTSKLNSPLSKRASAKDCESGKLTRAAAKSA
ncbi:MAG: hypothetical protein RLZZ152_1642, partial [Pseudomonadota bacterium]